mmetsp:Transcript_41405/g.133530  ORF Transcript_41405/g.133530 Transcript_41405/m.133530 type:complete len:208 (+) Transcript_41405:434-1057(+)
MCPRPPAAAAVFRYPRPPPRRAPCCIWPLSRHRRWVPMKRSDSAFRRRLPCGMPCQCRCSQQPRRRRQLRLRPRPPGLRRAAGCRTKSCRPSCGTATWSFEASFRAKSGPPPRPTSTAASAPSRPPAPVLVAWPPPAAPARTPPGTMGARGRLAARRRSRGQSTPRAGPTSATPSTRLGATRLGSWWPSAAARPWRGCWSSWSGPAP